MAPNTRITISDDGADLLEQIPIELRNAALRDAVRDAGRVVLRESKALCPPPGYLGDKPNLKPLRDTIQQEVREYAGGSRFTAVVGPAYPAGAHGHLVEFGHDLVIHGQSVGRVAPRPFLRPAADQTTDQQRAAIEKRIAEKIEALATV